MSYKIIIFIIVAVVVFLIVYKIKKKRKKHIGKFNIEQVVGEFQFRELYNALLTHEIPLPHSLQTTQRNKDNLLMLFLLFQRQLNIGIDWDMAGDQGNFMYHVLGPTLMTYGLTEKSPTKNKADSLGLEIIQTSAIGYRFYALLERWRVYNDEIMKDDITSTDN